jgi:hypothetical protein
MDLKSQRERSARVLNEALSGGLINGSSSG